MISYDTATKAYRSRRVPKASTGNIPGVDLWGGRSALLVRLEEVEGLTNERLRRLAEIGQSVWIDSISRDDLENGNLQRLIEEGVVGVTSNPTIFQKAISGSSLYDEQLQELAKQEDDPKEIFFGLAGEDIRDACDLMMPVH